MRTAFPFICSLLITAFLQGQTISSKIGKALKNLEADSQLKSAIIGFYLADSNGTVIFEKNSRIGLAMASSQKILTSIASMELLGADYRYKTELAYDGKIENGVLNGNLYLVGSGDPTLGSWRYDSTTEQIVLNNWTQSLKLSGIVQLHGRVIGYGKNWESQTIPGGWIWDDIGNYYGAGVSALNWRENQYDLILKSGKKEGDQVEIVSIVPKVYETSLINELVAGPPGSGDNAYIYLPPYANAGFVRGTIPPQKSAFKVSGSFPNPTFQLTSTLSDELRKQGIPINSATTNTVNRSTSPLSNLHTHWSPSLDTINYWFLKKSINLYGEAFVKTLGYEKKRQATTDAGLGIIKSFWKNNGIDPTSINIVDGSGLSPVNRITTEALVRAMEYARRKSWFSSFYNALPDLNGIKMKSGTMGGARSFTGYIRNYTFAIVVNNYNGSSAEMVRKLYKLLDILK